MMDRGILYLIVLGCCLCAALGGPVYTDCMRPPTILHGKTEMSVEDDGAVATYSCDPGYQLYGSSQLICSADDDIWQNDLPVCKLETGGDSTVSEIEPPIAAVPTEITHQEMGASETQEPVKIFTETDEEARNNNLSSEPVSVKTENEVPENKTTLSESSLEERRRKQNIQEDDTIEDEFASRLDMSCVAETVPTIVNAYISEFASRKHGEIEFMVAIYACEQDFDLENPNVNRIYCSDKYWIGNAPVCVRKGGSDEYDTDDYTMETSDSENFIKSKTSNPSQNPNPSMIDQQNVVDVEFEFDNKQELPSNGDQIEPHQNKNEVEITNNEILPRSEVDNSSNEANELPQNLPNVPTCNVSNGGCDQICNMVQNDNSEAYIPECSCSLGYYLDLGEGKHCIDINECEDPKIEESCSYGCENTIGSYHCIQPDPEAESVSTSGKNISLNIGPNAPVKTCGDGFQMDDTNNCIDINECDQGNTGCEHCQNLSGGFECVCPIGFELNSDDKTCRDIDECKTVLQDDYDENSPIEKTICSHECINTIGSYNCKCPLNFHLLDDNQTCEQDFCRHLSDMNSIKTKCSHDCVDDVDGYHCKCPEGMELDIDLKNCIVFDACQATEDRCAPGRCINIEEGNIGCECPAGYAAHNQRCVDYDECATESHQCSHKCKNTEGSYICQCPSDLILATDQHTCISSDLCQNNNGDCSDMCNVINENVVCSCSDGFELEIDAKTCRRVNICADDNGGCQHVCNEELNHCECYPGFETFDDGKTCNDFNECSNKPCAQQCLNTEGGYECKCFDGFEINPSTGECIDIDECLNSNHQCEHGCKNTEGSYMCICRDGYQLAANQMNCVDINECNVNNGGCSHTCINLPGDHKCTCPEGYRMDRQKQTCVQLEIADNCPALVPPVNGDVTCSRSRDRSQNFHKTKCSVWCHEGFTLIGPTIRYCNGSTGLWDSAENSCVRSTCPALSPPSYGSFSAPNCLSGNVYPGGSCTLTCAHGFKSVGNSVATCLPSRVWSTSAFNCVAVKTEGNLLKKRLNQGGAYQSGQINLDETVPVQFLNRISQQNRGQRRDQNILRPYIKCPRDTIIIIKDNQRTAFIKLEQPKSNVDWASHIDVEPAAAKSLQMRLPVGVHTFKFRARSPNSIAISDTCQTVITIKKIAPATSNNLALSSHPEVVFCPQNIQIQLQMNELRRAVSWKEPVFRPIQPLKQILKSSVPGTKFEPGHHIITYIATDVQNKNGTCQFSVIVRAPVGAKAVQSAAHPYLKDHDSYLMCPNRPAMKLDTTFPVQIPNGCFIKNVRINHYNPHRRRHAFAPNNIFLTHYSTWDRPFLRY